MGGRNILSITDFKGKYVVIRFFNKAVTISKLGYIIKNKTNEYKSLRDTVKHLSSQIDFDKKIYNRIMRKKLFPFLTLGSDKKALKKYLAKINPKQFPKASGELREVQLKLLELTKEVIQDLEKQGFHPSMTGGTLLGAVRHEGFIPWDEDIDFEIMQFEYEKLWEYVKTKYDYIENDTFFSYKDLNEKINIKLKENPNNILFVKTPIRIYACRGNSAEDCITLDFFPRAFLARDMTENEYQKYRNSKQSEYLAYKTCGLEFKFFEKELKRENIYANNGELIAKCWGSFGFVVQNKTQAVFKNTIFPLRRIKFEDTEFYAPNNCDEYLTRYYSKNYMKIPVHLGLYRHIKKLNEYFQSANEYHENKVYKEELND